MKAKELTQIKSLIKNANEDYLILIANRGLYKRAVNDLKKGNDIQVSLGDELIVEPEPGIRCRIGIDAKKSTCSCPSLKTCKHLVLSLLYLNEHYAEVFNEALSQEIEFSNETLLALSATEIAEKAGASLYDDALFRLSFNEPVKFNEAEKLEVHYPNSNIKLLIEPQIPLKKALCSCKKESCLHLYESLIRYQLMHGNKKISDFPYQLDAKINLVLVDQVIQLLADILDIGLARLPQNLTRQLEIIAVHCHTHRLSGLEKNLRALQQQISDYHNKQVGFTASQFRRSLVRAYTLCCQLRYSDHAEYQINQIGHRSSYTQAPNLHLFGLGSSIWQTQSGYIGITSYFLDASSGYWYSLTQSRQTYHQSVSVSIEELYRNKPWRYGGSLACLERSEIDLLQPQINRERRLSTTQDCTATIRGDSNIQQLNAHFYDDWLQCFDAYRQAQQSDSMISNNAHNLALLTISRWGKSQFDEKTQQFQQPIYDHHHREMQLQLGYDRINSVVIEKLEGKEQKQHLPTKLLVKLFLTETAFCAQPLVAFDQTGTSENLTME